MNEEIKQQIIQAYENGLRNEELEALYYELTDTIIKADSIRKQVNRWQKKDKPKVVGVIGDLHLPFEHPDYLEFCKETFKKWGVTEVVQIGDMFDNHSSSRHATELDAMGGYSEYTMAKAKLQAWINAFPKMKMLTGNHTSIPYRQAKNLGLHMGFMKTYHEMWELPKTWEVSDEFIIDNVLYTHGESSGGINGSLNFAQKKRMSVVLGHKHSAGGIRYSNNGLSNIFALDVSCGIDTKQYAFRYGKTIANKPVLGCAIVISDTEAYFIPMKKTLN